MTLSNLAKFSTSVARPLCDSWASCKYRISHDSS